MVQVHAQGLRKEFGSLVAVEEFDLTIDEGEFVTLVGPSGCGKTTTLRMFAGLETATAGRLLFGDRDVTDLPPQERDVALLFQDIALYPHMSVRDNMAYGLKIAGYAKPDRYERVEETADLLQITDLLDNRPADLSGGQQQRVALGRSMVRDPALFLFDEPMSDLDAKLKRDLRPLFEEVTKEIGCPTLYVTHDQEEAMTMSDRIVVMDDGRIAQVGGPEELYDDPDSEFVGTFIGQPTMQTFQGRVVEERDGLAVEVGEHRWPVSTRNGLAEYTDRPIRVGVRPQDISVTEDTSGGLAGEHVLDEPLGDRTNSFFDTPEGRVTVVTPKGFRGEGRAYGLRPSSSELRLFDPDSGLRIR
ncbi:ABC transporter ATP-binding protein [Halomarina oriensis]|uniref:ABC-type D-xylose/L-arabinose transporter n=1 Tax=Halomarina oriensis TaxID=671145 RepID=A0A6B0GW23_9EURY|nr:ABC transporter ATP-binding protein [Halomarina oriensis]MWG36345.1 ATP-binding cassette domain-containing protein [Halomarina oriensis]